MSSIQETVKITNGQILLTKEIWQKGLYCNRHNSPKTPEFKDPGMLPNCVLDLLAMKIMKGHQELLKKVTVRTQGPYNVRFYSENEPIANIQFENGSILSRNSDNDEFVPPFELPMMVNYRIYEYDFGEYS